ncbi:MAG: PDZ domain-containing protein, partial [Pyrinomonadaceae bacterium]
AEAPPTRATMPGQQQQQWGAVAPVGAYGAPVKQSRPSSMWWNWSRFCRPMRMNWMMWMILSIAILTATGVISRGVRGLRVRPIQINVGVPQSFLGVDGFDTAEGGGAMIEGIAAPGTPIEAAGLIGGDIITSFDGKQVADDDAMRDFLASTPVGKSVEVIYTRDGVPNLKTVLTTISEKSFRGLTPLNERPGGQGRIGVSNFDRVRVPNSNLYGVELTSVDRNGPADIAGLHEGDIVTDFNGKPVRTEGDLRLRIYEAVPGSTVNAAVMRDGARLEIPVKVGRSN